VPKAERLESLRAHLEHGLQAARTEEWRSIPVVPLLQELERQVEEANPEESEERVSFLCHRRLRKVAVALGRGWERELLGMGSGEQVREEEVDCAAILERLETLGPTKLRHYTHIKLGDFNREQLLEQDWGGNRGVTLEEYGQAARAQSSTVWHQEVMASTIQAFQDAGTQKILDIGSSFNPLQGKFPEVTAVDLVPAAPSVLQANFLEVPLRDGIGAALLEPSDPRRCAALPLGHFDGALLSNVLRAMPRRRDQRLAIARAARTLRVGGVLIIADLTKFRSLLSPRALRSWGLSQTAREDLGNGMADGMSLSVFRLERVGAPEAE